MNQGHAEPKAGGAVENDAPASAEDDPAEQALRSALLAAKGDNPFSDRFARSPWDDVALVHDVASLHATPSETLEQHLATVSRDGRSRVVLILGEAGSGKTHVLARLRRSCVGRALFAAFDAHEGLEDAPAALVDRILSDLLRPVDGKPQLVPLVDRLVDAYKQDALGSDLAVVADTLGSDGLDANVPQRLLKRELLPTVSKDLAGVPPARLEALFAARPVDREPEADQTLRALTRQASRSRRTAESSPGRILEAPGGRTTDGDLSVYRGGARRRPHGPTPLVHRA